MGGQPSADAAARLRDVSLIFRQLDRALEIDELPLRTLNELQGLL
jgi:hypothetical protein